MYLAETFPHCHVDAVEIEPAVFEVAKGAMGFCESSRLKVTLGDGAAFALEKAGSSDPYDAVLVDAMDGDGVVPPALVDPDCGLVRALAQGLLGEQGVVAINLFSNSNPAPVMSTYRSALAERTAGEGLGPSFAVKAEATYNVLAVTTCGQCAQVARNVGELSKLLQSAASEIGNATAAPFDMAGLFNSLQLTEQWRMR